MSPPNSKPQKKDAMSNTIAAVTGLAGGSAAQGQAAGQHASIPFTPKPPEPYHMPHIPKDEVELVKKKK
jgi:hypothetical protein